MSHNFSIAHIMIPLLQHEKPVGTRKVKYTAGSEWDFAVETSHQPIDLSLVLPHYRARQQPVHHRMGMFVGSDTAPIRVKVVSNIFT